MKHNGIVRFIIKNLIFGLLILAWHPVCIAGIPVFDITSTTKSINVPANTIAYFAYSVYNNAHGFPTAEYTPSNSTIWEGTTCNKSFPGKSSCLAVLRFAAPSTVGSTYVLNLVVCAAHNLICYQPAKENTIRVTVTNPLPPPPPPPPPAPLPFIAAGAFTDANNNKWPLLALSSDNASTWTFPSSITQPSITPTYFSGLAPSGLNDTAIDSTICTEESALCLAVGHYLDGSNIIRPLLAQSTNKGNTWSFSSTVSQPEIAPVFASNGKLEAVSCSHNSHICIAGGAYADASNKQYPLLTQSVDIGSNWKYPASIYTSLSSLNFKDKGIFHAVNCNDKGYCIAAGEYIDIHGIHRPLLAMSNDNGNVWSYVTSATNPEMTPEFFNNGVFYSVNCTSGGNYCAAVGSYVDTSNILRPLLAQSTDNGSTWSYPSVISQPNVPNFYIGMLHTINCNKSSCIAIGSYADTSSVQRPLLAQSNDAGNSWKYVAALSEPTLVPAFSDKGDLYGVHCSEDNMCIATGTYTDESNIQRPLLAQSTDGGNSWSYAAVSKPTTTPAFANYGLLGAPQCRGSGSTAICIASGSYQDISGIMRPLMVLTRDGGATWSFPENITQPTATPAFSNQGELYHFSIDESLFQYLKKTYARIKNNVYQK